MSNPILNHGSSKNNFFVLKKPKSITLNPIISYSPVSFTSKTKKIEKQNKNNTVLHSDKPTNICKFYTSNNDFLKPIIHENKDDYSYFVVMPTANAYREKICVDNYLFSLNTYPFVDSGKNTCYYWQCTYLFYNSVHKKYDRCQSRIVTIRYHDHLYFHLDKYGIIKKYNNKHLKAHAPNWNLMKATDKQTLLILRNSLQLETKNRDVYNQFMLYNPEIMIQSSNTYQGIKKYLQRYKPNSNFKSPDDIFQLISLCSDTALLGTYIFIVFLFCFLNSQMFNVK